MLEEVFCSEYASQSKAIVMDTETKKKGTPCIHELILH